MMHRCRISIQHLPVLILDSLPLVGISKKPIAKLTENTIYMKLLKHPGFYLIYELKQVKAVLYQFSLTIVPKRHFVECLFHHLPADWEVDRVQVLHVEGEAMSLRQRG